MQRGTQWVPALGGVKWLATAGQVAERLSSCADLDGNCTDAVIASEAWRIKEPTENTS